jgi:WD40 repeat protein
LVSTFFVVMGYLIVFAYSLYYALKDFLIVSDVRPTGLHYRILGVRRLAWLEQIRAGTAALPALAGAISSATFSPDGAHVVTMSLDGMARLWDATTGAPLAGLLYTSSVLSSAFSPDGARVVTAYGDGSVCIIDFPSYAPVVMLDHPSTVVNCAFSPDGKRIAAGVGHGARHEAWLWDAETLTLLKRLAGHADRVISFAFSPDSARVLTASADKTLKVWDVTTGALQATLKGHTGEVVSCAFSPIDSWRILSASADGARLWDGGRCWGTSGGCVKSSTGAPAPSRPAPSRPAAIASRRWAETSWCGAGTPRRARC